MFLYKTNCNKLKVNTTEIDIMWKFPCLSTLLPQVHYLEVDIVDSLLVSLQIFFYMLIDV